MSKPNRSVTFADRHNSFSQGNLSSVTQSQLSLNTAHEHDVNDAKLDYYGTRLATASSDKSVKIFTVDVRTGGYHQLAVLTGYDGPVWSVSWSHPKFGPLLASASYDGRVLIWKEMDDYTECENTQKGSRWRPMIDEQLHEASVNDVAWAAPQFGAILAAASSDGSILISSIDDQENWTTNTVSKAHPLGCQTVSWNSSSLRLASGGNDYNVKIWRLNDENEWTLETTLNGHTDWVYDVEWSPAADLLVSSGRDGRILAWTKREEPEVPDWNHSINQSQSTSHININVSFSEPEDWSLQVLQTVEKDCRPYVSWDPMGRFLCICGQTKEAVIWKYDGGDWTLV